MRIADRLHVAVLHIIHGKLRSILCVLSVGIGILSMILITATGLFGKQMLANSIDSLGISGLTVYMEKYKQGDVFTTETATKIEELVSEAANAMAIKAKTGSYSAGHQKGNAAFLGIDEQLGSVMNLEVLAGSLPSAQQVRDREQVAVVGDDLAKKIYGRTNIVGKTIRCSVGGTEQYYQVGGVVACQSSMFSGIAGSFIPTIIYVPYGCLANLEENADLILVNCIAENQNEHTIVEIKNALARNGDIQGKVAVQNMNNLFDKIYHIVDRGIVLFVLVAAVTLMVALVGVLSGMLSAAHEKKSEIGIYMALGATTKDILFIFLYQSVLLCLAGGICGLITASALIGLANMLFAVHITIPLLTQSIYLLLSLVCGVITGLFPAYRAARLSPVEAMCQL